MFEADDKLCGCYILGLIQLPLKDSATLNAGLL